MSADGVDFVSVKASEQTLAGNGATQLGFATGQSAPSVLTAGSTPSSFALTRDSVFAVAVNADTYNVFLPATATEGNSDIQALVDDLNSAFASAPGTQDPEAKLGEVVSARATQDGKLELYALNGTDTLKITFRTIQPVRRYSLDGSGLDAARYIRIQGSEAAGEPGSGGLKLDAVAATQRGSGRFPCGRRASNWSSRARTCWLPNPRAGGPWSTWGTLWRRSPRPKTRQDSTGPALAAQPFRFDMATPLVTSGGSDAAQSGISLLDQNPQAGDAFAFEGSASSELLSRQPADRRHQRRRRG